MDWNQEIERCSRNICNNLNELNSSMEQTSRTDDSSTRIKISNEYVRDRLQTIRDSLLALRSIRKLSQESNNASKK